MMADIKTTLTFSPQFHVRLKRYAELEGKPMARIVEEKLTPVIVESERGRLKPIYAGLNRLKGIIKAPMPDASATIDEVVYSHSQGAND